MVLNAHPYKIAKIYFCFAVLLFVAKPFLGFSMFSRIHPPAADNIFIKAFNKRKLEYNEDNVSSMEVILKNLANPGEQLFLRFSVLLSILFPLVFKSLPDLTNRFLSGLQFNIKPQEHTYLLNSMLLIWDLNEFDRTSRWFWNSLRLYACLFFYSISLINS